LPSQAFLAQAASPFAAVSCVAPATRITEPTYPDGSASHTIRSTCSKEVPMRKEKTRKQRHSLEDQAIYDRIRREFSASDLQKYAVIEKGVPLEKVIKKMEAIHRKLSQKKRTRNASRQRRSLPN